MFITDGQTPSTEKRWSARDGLTLVGEATGGSNGITVLLMHGGGQTRYSWSSLHRALSHGGYSVISYDARGHGNSDWSATQDYSFHTQAGDLMTVLSDVGGPVVLVGASMGGIAAMQAVADGLRPRALILVDIVLHPNPAGIERVRQFMRAHRDGFATIGDAVDAVAAYNPNRPRPADPSGLSRNLRLRDDGRLYWHYDPDVISPQVGHDISAMARIVAGLQGAPPVPTLLIRGRHSDVVTAESVARFKEVIPAVELVDVTAGHMVAGDSNDAFNRAVLEFLQRQFAGS